MLPTPGETPVTKNRFGALTSPVSPQRAVHRTPLSPKSENVAPSEQSWRVKRKPAALSVPSKSIANGLLPTPFHSTQRRLKGSQNRDPKFSPVTPLRSQNFKVPLTPDDSPFLNLASKIASVGLTTPPRAISLPLPASPVSPIQTLSKPTPSPVTTTTEHQATCAACSRVLSSAALLSPCAHLVCSPCLTGCLNAAGDKSMDCMACKSPIVTFELTSVIVSASGNALPVPQVVAASVAAAAQHARANATIEPVGPPAPLVKPISASLGVYNTQAEPCVLRIDNVPWDVTPEMLFEWVGETTPPLHAYALIDRHDGRTLSYAYLEVSPELSKSILRARQNSILGKGKRARAVTITHSSQMELMREIFPTWGGSFLGSKPCVVGMSNSQISLALRQGLLSPKEIEDILHLLRTPEAHFVKVPSLPYHHLAAILHKFPADKDSKVLHTPLIKSTLIEFVQTTARELRRRADIDEAFALPTMQSLSTAVSACKVLDADQRLQLLALFRNNSNTTGASSASSDNGSDGSPASAPLDGTGTRGDLFKILADTHKLDPKTVRALTMDFLATLTANAGSRSPGSSPSTPVYDHAELPPAVFSA